jgi:hypothetical protein
MLNKMISRRVARSILTRNKSFLNNITNQILNCEKSSTRFPVYYNSFERLDCNETLLNASLLKCIDTLLEWKLAKKLNTFYDIQLMPVFIYKHKMNCNPMYNVDLPKKFKCNLITKTVLNKKKVIWKLFFKLKNVTCEPEELTLLNTTKIYDLNLTNLSSTFKNTTLKISIPLNNLTSLSPKKSRIFLKLMQ